MRSRRTLTWLSWLALVLGAAAAAGGLLFPGGEGSFTFTTVHGEKVEMYGRGLYQHDSLFAAGTFLGGDIVVLAVGAPLLGYALWRTRRGSPRGRLLLTGTLSFYLYYLASLAFGAAYNPFFLLYVAGLGVSLAAFGLALASFDLEALAARVNARMPHRAAGIFAIVAGAVTGLVWLSGAVGALLAGGVPVELGPYTTVITYALDLAIVLPAAVAGGVFLLRRAPAGYPLGFTVILLNMLIGIVVVAQTIAQSVIGVSLNVGQFVVFVGSFAVMSLFAAWLAVGMLRGIDEPEAT
jgi:hypothetical protein